MTGTARQQAIQRCGTCGQPEDAHQFSYGTDEIARRIYAALGGACEQFVVSDAAVVYQKHLAITDHREPARTPGKVGKRNPMCDRCGHRHKGECAIQPGPPPGPDTYTRGAAAARAALAARKEAP